MIIQSGCYEGRVKKNLPCLAEWTEVTEINPVTRVSVMIGGRVNLIL